MMAAVDRLARRHWPAVAVLTLIVFALYGKSLFIQPWDGENLGALGETERTLLTFLTGEATSSERIPAYRPITFWSLGIHAKLTLNPQSLFAVNLLLWLAATVLVYALGTLVAASRLAGTLAAVPFAVDIRGTETVTLLVERQTSLAIIFGCSALLVMLRRSEVTASGAMLVAALLLASALSKEYGLAFAFAVAVEAIRRGVTAPTGGRWARAQTLLSAACGTVVAYIVLRFGVAGGAAGEFCGSEGFFFELRHDLCFGRLSTADRLAQYAYNIGAGLVGTLYPSLFRPIGALEHPRELFAELDSYYYLGILIGVTVGFWKLRGRALSLLALLCANAALGFVLYRTRNQGVGLVAVYVAFGYGTALILRLFESSLRLRLVRLAISLMAVALIGLHAGTSSDAVADFKALGERANPCANRQVRNPDLRQLDATPLASRDLVRRLGAYYMIPNAACRDSLGL